MSALKQTQQLLEIMTRLRDPEKGCPWDAEQTFATIAPYTIEEAYEVADAILKGDMEGLREELGDLLLQVVFHAEMAREKGLFDFEDVATAICDKMIERHPHVFGEHEEKSSTAQSHAWEAQKAAERERKARQNGDGRPSALDGVFVALPALTRAAKLQRRAARVGFDWDSTDQVVDKINEEIEELEHEIAQGNPPERIEDEMGDLLFACVNLARKLHIDPEKALRHGNAKFERRFRRVEALLAEDGKRPEGSTIDEMEALWQQAKAGE